MKIARYRELHLESLVRLNEKNSDTLFLLRTREHPNQREIYYHECQQRKIEKVIAERKVKAAEE